MKPPIIVDEQGDVMIFATVREAEDYVEPIDARSGHFVAYDGEGRLLRADVVRKGLIRRGVRLEPVDAEPLHAAALRESLVRFLAALGEQRHSLTTQSLDELVARALKRLQSPRKPGA